MAKLTAELETLLENHREEVLRNAPEHLRVLGPILRNSAETDALAEFQKFLSDHDISIPDCHLVAFRDYLIIHRIDLKDIEPLARERLRARTLAKEDPRRMSVDYQAVIESGLIPTCRDCKWFVAAPEDGGTNSDKSCAQMGTKGVDVACYGFSLPPG